MRNLNLFLAVFFGMVIAASAGSEYTGTEMKQVQPVSCPEWYADTEWNVSIWGTYAFTGTESNRTGREIADDEAVFGTYDRFLGDDHAWGGGLDLTFSIAISVSASRVLPSLAAGLT